MKNFFSVFLLFLLTNSVFSQVWTTYNTSNSGLAHNNVVYIDIDAQGNKWIGTEGGGVSKFDGTTWTTYNTSNSGLGNNFTPWIVIDAQGNKWFGAYGGGVSKFDGTTWTTYNTSNSGLVNNIVYAIAIDTQGSKWFGTDYGGVSKFDGTTWTTYNTSNSGLAHDFVNSLAIDTQGNKWFGTIGGGVSKFDGTTWTTYNTSNSGLADNNVCFITFDAQGNKWFGTLYGGVSKFDGTTWTTYNTSNSGLAANLVRRIAFDTQGNKWFGTDGGLSKFNGTTWTTYNTSNSGLAANYVYGLAIDTQGNKWLGTYGGGVSKLDEAPCNIPSSGLVAYYPFNGNANDISVNGSHGTVNGSTLTIDRFGNANSAYGFDGNDYIQISDNSYFQLTNDFTISSWFYANSFNAGSIDMILSKNDCTGGSGSYTHGVWDVSGSERINFQASPYYNAATYPSNAGQVNTATWYNFVSLYDKSTNILRYYLNGTLVYTVNLAFNITNLARDIYIGAQYCGGNFQLYWNGKIDDIAIYNRALSPSEVQSLYGANITAATTTSFCPGGSVILNANTGAGFTYQWLKDGTAISGATNASYTATQAGSYTVAVDMGTGCISTSAATVVTVFPLPLANAGADKIICAGASAQVIGTASVAGNTYTWSPTTGLTGAYTATPSANPTATTIYTVTVKNANNCTATDQVQVFKNVAITANAGLDQSICSGTSTSVTVIASGGTGALSYSWTATTGTMATPTSATTAVTPTNSTNYVAYVTDSKGCVKTDLIVVAVKPLPTVNAGTAQTSCAGSPIQIGSTAIANYTYTWSPTTGLSNAYISNPTASVTAATTYTVTANLNGCTRSASVLVSAQTIPSTAVATSSAASTCVGSGTNITLSCSSTGATTYSWHKVVGATYTYYSGNPYSISYNTTPGTYTYVCRTKTNPNNSCYTQSNPLTITIKEAAAPTIAVSNGVLSGTNLTVCYSTLPVLFTAAVSNPSGLQPSSWQWSFSPTGLTGSYVNFGVNGNSNTFTAFSKDYYLVTATYPNGCVKSTRRKIILNLACRMYPDGSDWSEEDDFSISPNPSNGLYNLNCHFSKAIPVSYQLYDTQGKAIRQMERKDIQGTQNSEINITNEASGVYLLEIQIGNETFQEKLIKE